MKYADIGSVSSGTMRTEDLLGAFADELKYHLKRNERTRGLDKRAKRKLIREARTVDPDTEEAGDIVDALFDALDEFSPPYVIFGAHPDDGADYGYWPQIDAIEEAVRDGEVANADDLQDNYRGLVVSISDHGNVELYDRTARNTWREIWSCV